MPQQQSVPTYGSAPPTSSPPAAAPQQQQQQSLLSSAHLLGTLNPTLAAALMSSALQQSTTTPAVPAAAPPVATGADAEQPVATLPPAAHHVPSLPVPFGLTGTNAFQQHRTPPVIHSITKMQKWSLEQLGKFDDVLFAFFVTHTSQNCSHASFHTYAQNLMPKNCMMVATNSLRQLQFFLPMHVVRKRSAKRSVLPTASRHAHLVHVRRQRLINL